jgi:ribonucleotide reductase alpha subunit
LGTIKSSNLCVEIVQYTSPDEVAVCNLGNYFYSISYSLASICLPKHVLFDKNGKPFFDHDLLFNTAKKTTRNLNKIIDYNYYALEEAKNSNLQHRPVATGVQGLADTFFKMGIAFDSPEARQLNKEIFETIYFAALTASNEISIQPLGRDG